MGFDTNKQKTQDNYLAFFFISFNQVKHVVPLKKIRENPFNPYHPCSQKIRFDPALQK